MKVGVLIPARNVLPYIETCLTTVRAQTYPCAAYIVDDSSTDGTHGFLRDRPTWYRRLLADAGQEPMGWPAALNWAGQAAIEDGCDAVFTMNSDDFLRLDCIEQCVRALQGADAVVPYTQQIGGENVVQASADYVTLRSFATHTPMVAFSLMRASVWSELGGYHSDVNLPGALSGYNEWDFWIRFHKAGFMHTVVKEPVVYYRMHPDQLHREMTARHQEAISMIYRKHPDVARFIHEGAS